MLTRLAILFITAVTIVSAGQSAGSSTAGNTGKCNVGELKCCQETQKPKSASAQKLLGAFGLSVSQVTGLLGVNCSPLTVGGIGAGANCNASPVCCTGNQFNGAIAIGCTPININL